MTTLATWDNIIGALGSTNTTFGGEWGNLISDFFNGVNIGLVDPNKLPRPNTLTRWKFEKLGLFDGDESHDVLFSVDDIDTGGTRKIKIRRMNTPFEEDHMVMEGMPQAILNKDIDSDLNTITNIVDADVKAAAGIVYSKLTLTNSIVAADLTTDSVITAKIQDNAVTLTKMADASIGTSELIDANVTLAKLASNSVNSSKIVDDSIVNIDINSAAAIVYSKLVLTNSIVSGDITDNAVITTKILDANVTLAKLASNSVNSSKIVDDSIVNADINSAAGISDGKLAQITNKSKLHSSIVYIDQANVYGDFLQTIRSSKFKIMNPGNTFGYTWVGAAIVADRNINIPLLTADDEPLFKDFTATIINKSISGSTNTITNIGDSGISSHTSTKITITTKGQLNSALVYNDQTNTYSDFLQTFRNSKIKLMNPANTFGYIFTGAAIVADRTINIPLMTGTDDMLLKDFASTIINKSIDADSNTITNIENADIKAAAGIVTSKLADSTNFLLKTLDNSFGAHFYDMTRIAAPANPSADQGRFYTKQIDTNNDGVFCLVKKNASFTEVQIV